MTKEQQLLDLAERVEREEPSRELDAAVALAVGWSWHPKPYAGFMSDPKRPRMLKRAPRFTKSIDAAETLPRRGVWMFVSKYPDVVCVDAIDTQGQVVATSRAPDEPRARTAAALRALAQEARDE